MANYSYKIYIQGNKLEPAHWEQFFSTILGFGRHFVFELIFNGNQLDFYLFHKKDLSSLSSRIYPFILKPEKNQKTQKVKEGFSHQLSYLRIKIF